MADIEYSDDESQVEPDAYKTEELAFGKYIRTYDPEASHTRIPQVPSQMGRSEAHHTDSHTTSTGGVQQEQEEADSTTSPKEKEKEQPVPKPETVRRSS